MFSKQNEFDIGSDLTLLKCVTHARFTVYKLYSDRSVSIINIGTK